MLKLWIIIVFVQNSINAQTNDRKNGFVDGDLIIGALFSIHENTDDKCGNIREQYGMHRVEVLLKTIKEINENKEILPGIKLGVDIRDSCWHIQTALEQIFDFIKNSITYQLKQGNVSKPIVALIGPSTSEATIQVQNLIQLFKIPQIGYSATSLDLSNKISYGYFMRVVPSDSLQVEVILDLIKTFKWNYISLLNSKGNYGDEGIRKLKEGLKNISVCIHKTAVYHKQTVDEFKSTVKNLFLKAKVVICFCQGDAVKMLLTTMKELNITNQGNLVIGTDGWADRTDIFGSELSEVALGSITIRLNSKPIPGFENYFKKKTHENTPGNPWFQEYWEFTFNCTLNQSKSKKYNKPCTGRESLEKNPYKEDSKLGFVVKSVMTIARGLHNIYMTNYSQNKMEFIQFISRPGDALYTEMKRLSFKGYDNETVSFDKNGDPPGRYEIMNYQCSYSEKSNKCLYQYVRIGSWKDQMLEINHSLIQWPLSNENNRSKSPIKSNCSEPCKKGEIPVISSDKQCCWTCKSCGEYEIVNASQCMKCFNGTKPNDDKTNCDKIPPQFVQWSYSSSIIAVIFSCIGILITVVITIIFIKFNNTPVVKSSTRELMYVILAGIILSYLTTFPLICKPSLSSCLLTRIMPGVSFSLIFGALVTKTNRICRILAISKKKIVRSKGKFLTTTSQVIIVLILNIVEIIVIVAMIAYHPPNSKESYPNPNETNLECNTNTSTLFISMAFDALLICLCTWYAFKTRNLPENFNEAKFIGFTMYTSCIVWIGLVVIYWSTGLLAIPLSFAMNVTATICIVLLFLPKVYIILYKPEKNERSAFTTTTEIRCHIGSGKTEYECTKNKSDRRKSYTNQNIKTPTDLRKCSDFRIKRDDYAIEQISLHHSENKTNFDKQTKLTQTEASQLIEFLLNLSDIFEGNIDEPTISQMALIEFMKDNWNRDYIPQLHDKGCMAMLCKAENLLDDDQISDTLLDDTDNDNSSVKLPMIAQSNSVLTCSPISNASTNASSTITPLFLEYLQIHGKQFKSITDKKSVKL